MYEFVIVLMLLAGVIEKAERLVLALKPSQRERITRKRRK